MSLTEEQQEIVDKSISLYMSDKKESYIKVNAIAGAGKSHTLIDIIKTIYNDQRTDRTKFKSRYFAYSKKLAVESLEKFDQKITECSTIHSMAYRATVSPLKLKLKHGNMYSNELINPTKEEKENFKHLTKKGLSKAGKEAILYHLGKYYSSRFYKISDYISSLDYDERDNELEELMVYYFTKMARGQHLCTHAFYQKLFHILLQNNVTNKEKYDVLLYDECISGLSGVKTEDGVIPIRRLFRMQEEGIKIPKAKSLNIKTGEFEYQEILKVFKNGKKQTFKVETGSKYSIKATSKHKVLTQRGYIEVKDLIPFKDYVLSDVSNNLRTAKLLNDDQLQVILGSYLGDGNLIQEIQNINCFSMRFCQGFEQKDYLHWKMKAFPSIKTKVSKSGYTGKKNIHQTSQVPNFILNDSIFNSVLNNLDKLGLAIWIMDDGYIDKSNRLIICSNSFTKEENEELSIMLQKRFNTYSKVVSNGKGHYQLSISRIEKNKLIKDIEDFIHPCFKNKWNIESKSNSIKELNSEFNKLTASYVISIKPHKEEDVYDMSVLNTNNYIITRNSGNNNTCSTIVHNCGDANEVSLEIFKLLDSKLKVMVGDNIQNIFGFNDTVNGFETMKDFGETLSLSKSFRVSEEIAKQVELFGRKYADKNMIFKGIKHQKTEDNSFAYISRTNSALIGKMIDLDNAKKQYNLTRSADDMFKVMIGLLSIKESNQEITTPELKHIQKTVNDFYDEESIQREFKNSLFSYIMNEHSDDIGIKSACTVISIHKPIKIWETYYNAKNHAVGKQDHYYTLTTCHSSKGMEYDTVYIMDDFNDKLTKVLEEAEYFNDKINKKLDEDKKLDIIETFTSEQNQEIMLYYVGISRAKYRLLNAKHLECKDIPEDSSINLRGTFEN